MAQETCGRCGYDLTGRVGETCPECGFEVTRTPYLRFADPGWLRTLLLGIELVRIGAIAAQIALGAAIVIAATGYGAMLGAVLPVAWFMAWFVAGCLLLALFGALLVATPDPLFEDPSPERRRERTISRAMLLAAIIAVAAAAVLRPLLAGPVAALVSIGAIVLAMVAVRRSAEIARSIVRRSFELRGADLERIGRGCSGFVVAFVVVMVIGAVGVLRRGLPPATMALPVEIGAVVAGGFALVSALLSLLIARKAIRSEMLQMDREGRHPPS